MLFRSAEFCAAHKDADPVLYRSLDIWPSDADRASYLADADGSWKNKFDAFRAAYGDILTALYGDHPFQVRIEYARYRHMGLGAFNSFHANKHKSFRAGINQQQMWTMNMISKAREQGNALLAQRDRAVGPSAVAHIDDDIEDEGLEADRARYGRASVGGGPFDENLDIIELNSNFRYTGLTATPRWYLPAPDVKLLVETELDRLPRTTTVPDATNPHHLRVQPTLGLAFSLNPFFSWRLGAGIEWQELLLGDDPTYVFVGEVKLTPYSLFSLRGRSVTWQAELKAQVNQAFSDAQPGPTARDFLLTGSTRLAVPVFQTLNFTVSYDTFVRLARGNELGVSHDLTLGLAWTWGRALQTFR